MKPIFASIEIGDKLYVVYNDIYMNTQIAEATVTGFSNWIYHIDDRYYDYGDVPQKSINYEFSGIKFSSNLEHSLNRTYLRDVPLHWVKYSKVMGDRFVIVFTTYKEAKEWAIKDLQKSIDRTSEQIKELEHSIEKYNKNIFNITNNEKPS